MINKKSTILISSTILLTLGCNQSTNDNHQAEKTPNVLLIVADDLGYRDLQCYGNPVVETPSIDKLAKEGVMFTNAYASASVCSPTRASLLTGKNPVAINLTDFIPGRQANGPKPFHKLISPKFNWQLPLEETTLAEKLKENGYATASIGKWHLGDTGYLPTQHGFDINIAGNDYGMPPTYYYPYSSEKKWRTHKITPLDLNGDSLYLTDRLTKEAIDFIEGQKNNPFFLYLPYYAVHTPLEGPSELVEKYTKKVEAMNDSAVYYPHFLAMTECMDQNVGRLMKKLEELGLVENTLIIFVSDNGGWYTEPKSNNKIILDREMDGPSDNSPLRNGKGTLYEGGIRVPTIIKWKGKIMPGRISDEMIISTDIFPTVLDILNIDFNESIEGKSIASYLLKNSKIDRQQLFWHYPHYHKTTPVTAMRYGDYKLIRYYENNRLELYDLEDDLEEQNNLADSMPDKVKQMVMQMDSWLKDQKAKLPKANPDFNME